MNADGVMGLVGDRLTSALKDAELLTQTLRAGVHGAIALDLAKSSDPWVQWRPLAKRVKTMVDVLMGGLLAPLDIVRR